MTTTSRTGWLLLALALLLVTAAGCSGDDDAASDEAGPDTTAAEERAGGTTPGGVAPSGEFGTYCAAAAELAEARRGVADELGTDPDTADPPRVEAAVMGQVEAMQAAAAVAPAELQAPYETATANLDALVGILTDAGWDYGAAASDPDFAKVATDAEASLALSQISTFDIGQCGILP